MYFADGRRIRKVFRESGLIATIVGTYKINEWQPQDECERRPEWPLHWPSTLAIHPFDQSLYFLDGGEVLTLKANKVIRNEACYGTK